MSNVISVLIGLAGVAYTCWLLAECPPSYRFCDRQSFIEFEDVEDLRRRCSQNFYTLDVSLSLSLVLRAGLSVHLRSGLGVFPEDRSRLFLVCISCFIFPVSGGSLRAPRPLPGSPRPADLRHHRRLCFLWESHPAPHTIFSQRKTPPTNNINSASQEMLMCSVAREKKKISKIIIRPAEIHF